MPEPGNPQAWDRYAFVYNNPVRYVDPSGHDPCLPKFCGYIHDDEDEKPTSEWLLDILDDDIKLTINSSNPNPPFDHSLGGNNPGTSDDNPDQTHNPPNVIGVIIGGVITLVGGGITLIGIGLVPEDPPAGFFIIGAGAVTFELGIEVMYQSLGDLRPSEWPDWLLINIEGLKRR